MITTQHKKLSKAARFARVAYSLGLAASLIAITTQTRAENVPMPWASATPSDTAAPVSPAAPSASPASTSYDQDSSSITGLKPGDSLHLTQKAWDNPTAHEGKGQSAPGYVALAWAPDKILPIHTREGLISNVIFPQSETIVQIITSDPAAIEAVASPDKHKFSVKPVYPGIDGNIIVYGSSGNVYNFYLQSVPYDNPTISDLLIRIEIGNSGTGQDAGGYRADMADNGGNVPYPPGYHHAGGPYPYNYGDDPSASLTTPRADAARPGKDFNAVARTGPGRLRTDLRILEANEGDSIIAPVAAWRDDKFTYLDFGPRAASMNTWPVASLVVDKIESPVGTRVAGPDRSIMVVEAIGDIVLRNGQHVVCIKLDDLYNDPRHPRFDEPYRDRPGLAEAQVPIPGHMIVKGYDEPAIPPPPPVDAIEGPQVISGPYRVNDALLLASDIVRGYRGKIQSSQIHFQTTRGREATHDELATAAPRTRYVLRIDAATDGQARTICSDLRHSGRPCRVN